MKMSIVIKPIHPKCIGRDKCSGCLSLTKNTLEEIGAKNVIINSSKVYFEYDDIKNLVVELNSRNLFVQDWVVIE